MLGEQSKRIQHRRKTRVKRLFFKAFALYGIIFGLICSSESLALEQAKPQISNIPQTGSNSSLVINQNSRSKKTEDSRDFIISDFSGLPQISSNGDTIYFAASSDQHYGDILNDINPLNPWDFNTVDDWMSHPDINELDFVFASLGDWIGDIRDFNSPWKHTDYTWGQVVENGSDHHRIPFFWVMGNHDISCYECLDFDVEPCNNPMISEKQARIATGLNENCYAFMYNNILFVVIGMANEMFDLSNFQKSWLKYLLDRYHDNKTVLLSHIPIPRTTGDPDDDTWTSYSSADYRAYNDSTWWYDLFDENQQIILYIHGHNHNYREALAFNRHAESWDDHCTFINLGSTHYDRNMPGSWTDFHYWSYIFRITDDNIGIRIWHSDSSKFVSRKTTVGVPYVRNGMDNNVSEEGMQWFSIPKQVLDGQQWSWKNRMIAEGYTLEVVGIDAIEQINNPDLSGCWMEDTELQPKARVNTGWYSIRGDYSPYVLNRGKGQLDGFIRLDNRIYGGPSGGVRAVPVKLELAASSTADEGSKYYFIEGKVPYNTAVAIPGKTYTFACSLRTASGYGTVDYLISIPKYENLRNWVWEDSVIASDIVVDGESKLYSQSFTLPNNENMWFIQPKVVFKAPNEYYMESWSLQMQRDGNMPRNISVNLNGYSFHNPGNLAINDFASESLPATVIDNDLEFSVSIEGSKVGLVRLIYERPSLWSDDVTFGILSENQDVVYIEDISPYNLNTSIMSFNDSPFGIWGEGFLPEIYRGKYSYISSDPDIMGTYYIVQPINLELGTAGTVYSIPAGESFSYRAAIKNNTKQPVDDLELWIEVENPVTGESYNVHRENISMEAEEVKTSAPVAQPIPSSLTPGDYNYMVFCGYYPETAFDSANIYLNVQPGISAGAEDWNISRWFDDAVPVANEFAVGLDENYPNPFNASTTISYSFTRDSEVKLEIFNLLGQRIETLVDTHQNPGVYHIKWDGSRVASGIYLYRLTAGDKVITKRMAIIK
ncbi:MAG: T9SS type A sorting domain-containing protein [candidate division Zixibacteria bacterium]|nr:T9SS type A sorting domain-containing protein [candidate division Zixibacteria bacterium]